MLLLFDLEVEKRLLEVMYANGRKVGHKKLCERFHHYELYKKICESGRELVEHKLFLCTEFFYGDYCDMNHVRELFECDSEQEGIFLILYRIKVH